jgi:hypothetical protein
MPHFFKKHNFVLHVKRDVGFSVTHSCYLLKSFYIIFISYSLMSEKSIIRYLNKLGSNKSTGLDGNPSRFVRDGASIIAFPLTHISFF